MAVHTSGAFQQTFENIPVETFNLQALVASSHHGRQTLLVIT